MQVLATGLSGLYSSLPTKLEEKGEDWHCLLKDDWLLLPPLVQFMNSLEFCNAVIQVLHGSSTRPGGLESAESSSLAGDLRVWAPSSFRFLLNEPFFGFETCSWSHRALLESHWISWNEWNRLIDFWKFQWRTNERFYFLYKKCYSVLIIHLPIKNKFTGWLVK